MDESSLEDMAYMREIDSRFNDVPDIVLVRLYLDWSNFFACSWHCVGRGEETVKYIKNFARWALPHL